MNLSGFSSIRIAAVGLSAGFLFAVADALLNANPLARRLYEAFRPIARESVNATLGLAFDLIAGLAMAILFVVLAPALPGGTLGKGIAFGLIAWFFRVAMQSASQLVMFRIPGAAVLYGLTSGLIEMLLLGVFYSLLLRTK